VVSIEKTWENHGRKTPRPLFEWRFSVYFAGKIIELHEDLPAMSDWWLTYPSEK